MREFKIGDKIRLKNTEEGRELVSSWGSEGLDYNKTYTITYVGIRVISTIGSNYYLKDAVTLVRQEVLLSGKLL